MENDQLLHLEQFIVRAKRATYAGDGPVSLPYRAGSHDLQFMEGDWTYHDSYFGGSDFLGQEIVYHQMRPVWGMNYYGRLLHPDRITAAETGQRIKKSLTVMYAENRFLGGFEYADGDLKYTDSNEGDLRAFTGKEIISLEGETVYELVYHGGLIT